MRIQSLFLLLAVAHFHAPYPLFSQECLQKCLQPMFNAHFFCQQFLFLLSFPLIQTICIKELTFSLHFTHNQCTSLHFANNFQACKSRYELALVLTARRDYTNREISPCISNVLTKRFRGHYPFFHFISLDLLYTWTPNQVSSQNIYNAQLRRS